MIVRSSSLIIVLILAWLPVACERAAPPNSAASEFEEWSASAELIFGHLDDPVYSFGPIRSMAMAPGGEIYTAHPQENLIRRWTTGGELRFVVGGRGEGPGEFLGLGAVGVFGDTLWAMDTRGARVTYFDDEGSVIGTIPLRVDPRGQANDPHAGRPRPILALSDGSFYGIQSSVFPQIAGTDSTAVLHLRLDSDSHVLDTLYTGFTRKTDVMAVRSPGGNWLTGSQPFADGSLTAADPNTGILVVVERPAYHGEAPARIEVTGISMMGDTLFQQLISYEPVRLGEAAIEEAISNTVIRWERGQGAEGGSATAALQELARNALFAPPHYPPLSQVVLGQDGTIWLRGARSEGSEIDWKILDAKGNPLGLLHLPGGFRVLVADRQEVWGVQRNSTGVDYVRRFRIEPRSVPDSE